MIRFDSGYSALFSSLSKLTSYTFSPVKWISRSMCFVGSQKHIRTNIVTVDGSGLVNGDIKLMEQIAQKVFKISRHIESCFTYIKH